MPGGSKSAKYARQEQRRGRRHAFETLDPSRTALVVIDIVSFFVAGSSYCLGIVPNITALAARCAQQGHGSRGSGRPPGTEHP